MKETKQPFFSKARFLLSALDEKDFPSEKKFPSLRDAQGQNIPQIALIGRSNVGKSSLICHLLQKKNVAKVSATPGKTRAVNFFLIDEKILLVDLPGYGYAKAPLHMQKKWSKSIESYLHEKKEGKKLLLQLLDIRHLPSKEDHQFIDWALYQQFPLLLVLTKTDKLKSASQIRKQTLLILRSLEENHSQKVFSYVHYSIKEGSKRAVLHNTLKNFLLEKSDEGFLVK